MGIHPLIAIYGTPDETGQLNSVQKEMINFTSSLARHPLLLYWKYPNPLFISQALEDTVFSSSLRKINIQ